MKKSQPSRISRQSRRNKTIFLWMITVCFLTAAALLWLLLTQVPDVRIRLSICLLCLAVFAAAGLWNRYQHRQLTAFADDICETLDALMAGRPPENYHPYEDTLTARVQGKLLQYSDILKEGQLQSQKDKQTLQSLVSDISHQVRTPIANLRMFADILQTHSLSREKRAGFINTMSVQIGKLDFLMQSLIKMSRLETGTFVLHLEECSLYNTIAQAVSTVWGSAEQKEIQLSVTCDSQILVKHDSKWTAEALGNILDNAIKYTPPGGDVSITVRPWQFYTRIDIADTGIGIAQAHYHDIFRRFYRAPETAGEEGVGLGLYLARGIITRQKGYISVKSSQSGAGTVFSVYLLN